MVGPVHGEWESGEGDAACEVAAEIFNRFASLFNVIFEAGGRSDCFHRLACRAIVALAPTTKQE